MKNFRSAVLRDFGIAILLLWAFSQALVMTFAEKTALEGYLIMIFVMDAAVLIGFAGRMSICTVMSSMLTCAWVGYKLYAFYEGGEMILPMDYVIVPLPILGMAACALYQRGLKSIDSENTMLRQQVEELVLVDEVTGLYNQRALYRDLRSLVRYGERNNMPISLMIVQPRYEAELRGMLPRKQYLKLRQEMAAIITDGVRVEDKTYCIDERCTIAIALTTNEDGSQFVKNRLKAALQKDGAFEGVLDRGTKLDVRFACKEYNRERFGDDMMAFKSAVESELVYDV